MKKVGIVRQGDVFLVPVDANDDDMEPMVADPRGLVLAEGESSGHFHVLFGSGAKLMRYKSNNRLVALVDDGGEMRVVGGGSAGKERHDVIVLKPGRYEVRTQRSWTSANASRQVRD